jgi:hypothetical protein
MEVDYVVICTDHDTVGSPNLISAKFYRRKFPIREIRYVWVVIGDLGTSLTE